MSRGLRVSSRLYLSSRAGGGVEGVDGERRGDVMSGNEGRSLVQ